MTHEMLTMCEGASTNRRDCSMEALHLSVQCAVYTTVYTERRSFNTPNINSDTTFFSLMYFVQFWFLFIAVPFSLNWPLGRFCL